MEDKKPELIPLGTPDNTFVLDKEKGSACNEDFHDVKDKNLFFQTTKIFDIDNSRESLMLLKNLDEIDITRNSLGISKEQLGLRKEPVDFERESLGIFPMSTIDDKLSEFNNTPSSISSVLNRAILCSNSHSSPFLSNTTYNSLKTPDIQMFKTFDYSEVFSPMKSEQSITSHLQNVARTFLKNECDKNAESKNIKMKTKSLSTEIEAQKDLKETILSDVKKKFCRSQSLKQYPITGHEEDRSNFNDSILMEARVLASKIGDNSIFEENGEICKLDCVLQPDWADDCNEHGTIKDSKTVENIEKTAETASSKNKELKNDSPKDNKDESPVDCDKIDLQLSNTVSPNTCQRNETIQNLSKIFQNKSLSTSRISCSSNKSSKDTKEILENLSEILSSENPTSEQKSEGQNLLYSLADILYNSRSLSKKDSSDDSGHSSIENDRETNNDSPKVLDLRCKPTSAEREKPLDLSTNRQKPRLNRSTSCPSSGEKPEHIQVPKSCQVNVPGGFNNFNKLKPKRAEDKKKGPLKAILPLKNMSKVFSKQNRGSSTPSKHERHPFGNKRTSTPKTEPKLCPVAQSTPDDAVTKQKTAQVSPSQLPKPKFNYPVSPLARPNTARDSSTSAKGIQRTLTDSSLSKLKNASSTNSMTRRKSSDDIKLQASSTGLKRSNSASNNVKLPTVNSGNKKSLLEKNCNKNLAIKSIKLISKFKKSAGKENLPQ